MYRYTQDCTYMIANSRCNRFSLLLRGMLMQTQRLRRTAFGPQAVHRFMSDIRTTKHARKQQHRYLTQMVATVSRQALLVLSWVLLPQALSLPPPLPSPPSPSASAPASSEAPAVPAAPTRCLRSSSRECQADRHFMVKVGAVRTKITDMRFMCMCDKL
jgi:hypothetical protein